MTATEPTTGRKKDYRRTNRFGETIWVSADWAQASSPIYTPRAQCAATLPKPRNGSTCRFRWPMRATGP